MALPVRSSPPTVYFAHRQKCWVAGSSTADVKGVYGTQRTAAASNEPGARNSASAWTNHAGEGSGVSLRIVRLGSERQPNEGLRIGTVRRPPRGVAKQDYARRHFFDVWLPLLAPSEALLHEVKASAGDERSWRTFVRKFRREMQQAEAARTLDLLAALSHSTQLSVGCYCADEGRCHRSILRELLTDRAATFAAAEASNPTKKTL
jgi:uncharacterized protein YeaO (DUF488 family)